MNPDTKEVAVAGNMRIQEALILLQKAAIAEAIQKTKEVENVKEKEQVRAYRRTEDSPDARQQPLTP